MNTILNALFILFHLEGGGFLPGAGASVLGQLASTLPRSFQIFSSSLSSLQAYARGAAGFSSHLEKSGAFFLSTMGRKPCPAGAGTSRNYGGPLLLEITPELRDYTNDGSGILPCCCGLVFVSYVAQPVGFSLYLSSTRLSTTIYRADSRPSNPPLTPTGTRVSQKKLGLARTHTRGLNSQTL